MLGGADIEIFTRITTFAIMQSLRLDRGPAARSIADWMSVLAVMRLSAEERQYGEHATMLVG